MVFVKRLKYYLIGVGIGTLMVILMLGTRDDIQCSYFPNARVIKNISTKKIEFTEKAQCQFNCMGYTDVTIDNLLKAGDVDFGKSETKNDSCNVYYVTSKFNDAKVAAIFENCDSIATVLKFELPVTASCDCN